MNNNEIERRARAAADLQRWRDTAPRRDTDFCTYCKQTQRFERSWTEVGKYVCQACGNRQDPPLLARLKLEGKLPRNF